MRQTTSYVFGAFRLDATAYQLLADGQPVAVSPKVLDLLFLFAARPGALLTKDEILAALWSDVAVTDNALTQVVSELRQALGDSPSEPRFVQTVARRGYRFVGTATVADVAPRSPAEPPEPMRTVAVQDFANQSHDAELAWLSTGLADTVANGLRLRRDLRLLDRGSGSGKAAITVRGGFQRIGAQIRLTAEAVETATGRSLVQAKADGTLSDLFQLQDALVDQLATSLPGLGPQPVRPPRPRETSSLEAYRALTEGRLKLEALDPALVPGAIDDFERALRWDEAYALAHAGLAHAHLWTFQASRVSRQLDRTALATAVAHARRAVDLDPEMAEGHAALAFLLASAGRSREAVEAGRVATALEPANWRHQFRLGLAAWGAERLDALEAVLAVYPQLSYAHFGIAMVYVARADLVRAERVLRGGLSQPASRDARFPGGGLHWLLGLLRLAAGDTAEASAEFDREVQQSDRSLFGDEFSMDAEAGQGFIRLGAGDARGAADRFERALARVPDHAGSLVGLAVAWQEAGQADRARRASVQAEQAIRALGEQGRLVEAAMTSARFAALSGRHDASLTHLETLLGAAGPGHAGWTIPVEPALAALRPDPRFQAVLEQLSARAV